MTKLADPHAVAPYPAFEVVLPQGLVPTLVQLGLQYPDDDRDAAAAASEGLAGLLDSEHPPVSVERAAHVDPEGFRTDIVLAYWAHPAHHLAWRRTRVVCDWFASLCTGPVGGWREAVAAPRSHMETSGSTADVRWGLGGWRGETTGQPVHAFYGAMRDRIDAAEDGGLPPAIGPLTRRVHASRGAHLVADLPANLCFIRTVQGVRDVGEAERAQMEGEILPAYQRGVAHLREHPEETSCLSARLVTDLPAGDGAVPQLTTETLAWFRSLADLEAWTHHHPTHEAIFAAFGAMAARLGFRVDTLLGHEVWVPPPGLAAAEYVNCHPATGLLPFVDVASADERSTL